MLTEIEHAKEHVRVTAAHMTKGGRVINGYVRQEANVDGRTNNDRD